MTIPPRQIPNLPDIARMIATLTEANGGATWNLVEGDLAGRPFFAVSVFPERAVIVADRPSVELAVEIEDFIRANRPTLVEDPQLSIGTWVNEGQVHLDLSITVSDRETALAIGQRHNQQAIFDLATFEEIAVPAAADERAA